MPDMTDLRALNAAMKPEGGLSRRLELKYIRFGRLIGQGELEKACRVGKTTLSLFSKVFGARAKQTVRFADTLSKLFLRWVDTERAYKLTAARPDRCACGVWWCHHTRGVMCVLSVFNSDPFLCPAPLPRAPHPTRTAWATPSLPNI